MNDQQIKHAVSCLNLFNKTAIDKYTTGQKEHGGNMWEKSGMLYNAYQENVDQMFYLSTIGSQIDLAIKFLEEGHSDKAKQVLTNLVKTKED